MFFVLLTCPLFNYNYNYKCLLTLKLLSLQQSILILNNTKGWGLSFGAHTNLAGSTVLLQGIAACCWRVHGLGDTARENTCSEWFPIYWSVGVQCCHHKWHCGGVGKSDIRTCYIGFHNDNSINTNLNDSHFVPALHTKAAWHMGQKWVDQKVYLFIVCPCERWSTTQHRIMCNAMCVLVAQTCAKIVNEWFSSLLI